MTKLIPRIDSELKAAEFFSPDSYVITVTESKRLLALCKTLAAGIKDVAPATYSESARKAFYEARRAAEEAGL